MGETIGGDAAGTLQQFLNKAWLSCSGSGTIRRQRQMLKLPLTEYALCSVFRLRDLARQYVYLLHDFSGAQIIRPNVASGTAGNANSADKLNLVIESVRPGTRHSRSSTVTVPDGAGGCPSPEYKVLPTTNRTSVPTPLCRNPPVSGVISVLCAEIRTRAPGGGKTPLQPARMLTF